MAAKCHFAHGKEDLRNIHDQLPANTPYITDPKTAPGPQSNLFTKKKIATNIRSNFPRLSPPPKIDLNPAKPAVFGKIFNWKGKRTNNSEPKLANQILN